MHPKLMQQSEKNKRLYELVCVFGMRKHVGDVPIPQDVRVDEDVPINTDVFSTLSS